MCKSTLFPISGIRYVLALFPRHSLDSCSSICSIWGRCGNKFVLNTIKDCIHCRPFTRSHFFFFGLYFHFCLELAWEIWAKSTLRNCLVVHDLEHAHSLASFQWSGPSDQRILLPTENCLQYPWYKGRGVVSIWEMIQPLLTKAFLQPPKTAVMCTSCHDYAHPPPPISLLLLVQNLSSKWIVAKQIVATCSQSQTTPNGVISG